MLLSKSISPVKATLFQADDSAFYSILPSHKNRDCPTSWMPFDNFGNTCFISMVPKRVIVFPDDLALQLISLPSIDQPILHDITYSNPLNRLKLSAYI